MTIRECGDYKQIHKITASKPFKDCPYNKITVRRVQGKDGEFFQAEKFTQTQVFHENVPCVELSEWLDANVA